MSIFFEYKFEVFKYFKMLKAMLGNETWLEIKKLKIDNGDEYEDTKFKKLCFENIIIMERSVSDMP